MKMTRHVSVLCLAFLTLFGCASVPEPKPGSDILVVAKSMFVAAGMPWSYVNGAHNSGIKVWIYHIDSKKAFSGISSPSGLVAFTGLPEGRYAVVQLSIKIAESSSTYTTGVQLNGSEYGFAVEPGKVTNLGQLVWTETYTKFDGGSANAEGTSTTISASDEVNVGSGYDNTQMEFQKANPKSLWNTSPWVNANFDDQPSPNSSAQRSSDVGSFALAFFGVQPHSDFLWYPNPPKVGSLT